MSPNHAGEFGRALIADYGKAEPTSAHVLDVGDVPRRKLTASERLVAATISASPLHVTHDSRQFELGACCKKCVFFNLVNEDTRRTTSAYYAGQG